MARYPFQRFDRNLVLEDYRSQWKTLDGYLYDLCQQHQGHETLDVIHAKLWIIGRTYATGIERKLPTTGNQGGALTRLANAIYKERLRIDQLFNKLFQIQEPLDEGKLVNIIKYHSEFAKIIMANTKMKQMPRSFTSKYMHFHCPAVPIYDSFANRQIKKEVKRKNYNPLQDQCSGIDQEYADYVSRYWQLYQKCVGTHGQRGDVKLIDHFLLSRAGMDQ